MVFRYIVAGFVAFAALLGVAGAFGSFYTIDEGERGVVLRNGAITGVATPGLHFKMPFIDGVEPISIRESAATFDMEAYSRDQQPATLKVSVNYRIDPAAVTKIYSTYGSAEQAAIVALGKPLPRYLKESFGTYSAQQLIQDRARLGLEVERRVSEEVADAGLVIVSIQIEDISFDHEYERSIMERMKAEVEVARRLQDLEKEKVDADIKRTQAAGQRLAADAEAYQIEARGKAEANAIRERGEALRENPDLPSLVAVEKWNGALPTTQVPGSTLPFIGLK